MSKQQLIVHRFLLRLEWLQSFEIVDADEECSERHLEIVCRHDKVPRTRDIVKIFGKNILHLITYKKGDCSFVLKDSLCEFLKQFFSM